MRKRTLVRAAAMLLVASILSVGIVTADPAPAEAALPEVPYFSCTESDLFCKIFNSMVDLVNAFIHFINGLLEAANTTAQGAVWGNQPLAAN